MLSAIYYAPDKCYYICRRSTTEDEIMAMASGELVAMVEWSVESDA
jgi:hypothetical protein